MIAWVRSGDGASHSRADRGKRLPRFEQCQREIRVDPVGLAEIGKRLLDIALGAEGETAVVIGGGELAVDPDGLTEIGDGAVVTSPLLLKARPRALKAWLTLPEFSRMTWSRSLMARSCLADLLQRLATIEQRDGEAGIDRSAPGRSPSARGHCRLCSIGCATVVVGRVVVRIGLDGAVEVGNGALNLAPGLEDRARGC